MEDDLASLLAILPAPIAEAARSAQAAHGPLEEIRVHVGRRPQVWVADRAVELACAPVRAEDVAHIDRAVRARSGRYTEDLRAALDGSLHRISPVLNGPGHIIGFSLRPGRLLTVDDMPLAQLVQTASGKRRSLLLIGPPGSGKTTKLRSIARDLADHHGLGMSVIVADPSGEIAGSGDVPHAGIGSALRLPGAERDQFFLIHQAIRNHGARVVVVDEIGRLRKEAELGRAVASSGIALVATTHAQTLADVLDNGELNVLLGGVRDVTVTDATAARNGDSKVRREQFARPVFDVAVELHADHYLIHHDVDASVKAILAGRRPTQDVQRVERTRAAVTGGRAPQRPAVIQGGGRGSVPSRVASDLPRVELV